MLCSAGISQLGLSRVSVSIRSNADACTGLAYVTFFTYNFAPLVIMVNFVYPEVFFAFP